MPLNRIHASKVTLNWIRLLEANNGKHTKLEYIPGLNIFPIKEAGWFLGKVDIGFWAALLYVLGSVFYVIDCFYLYNKLDLEADDDNPSGYGAIFNLLACSVFIANALLCFVDWWLQYKQISISTVGFEINDTSEPVDLQFSYKASFFYFNNNVWFLVAAVVYTVQGIWWVAPRSDTTGCGESFYCSSFSINFWAAFSYLVSALFAILEYYDYCTCRKRQGLKPLEMFISPASEMFDWFGWGDWFYLLAAAYELWQAMDVVYLHTADDEYEDSTYLISQSLFLIDSLFYFVGYIIYCLELKNAFNSGVLSAEQFKEVSKYALHADQLDEAQALRRSSLLGRPSLKDMKDSVESSQSNGNTIPTALILGTIIENDLLDGPIDIAEAMDIINAVKERRSSQFQRSSLSNPLIKKTTSNDNLSKLSNTSESSTTSSVRSTGGFSQSYLLSNNNNNTNDNNISLVETNSKDSISLNNKCKGNL